MSEPATTPAKKSFLRKLFSQAEPAPSKRPAQDPDWRPQSEVLDSLAAPTDAIDASPPAPEVVFPDLIVPIPLAEETPPLDREPLLPAQDANAHGIPETPAVSDAQAVPEDRAILEVSPSRAPDGIPVVEQAVVVAPAPKIEQPPPEVVKRTWWSRLRDGLSRSSNSIGTGIGDIFTKRKLDSAMLEDLEDVLIRADLGVATATRICEAVGKGRYDRDVSPEAVKAILAAEVERVLAPHAHPIAIDAAKPFVILVVGVNGSGKTTTIGKLAAKFRGEGKTVMLAAGDTFRAAAIAQLKIWGERLGCPVVAREQGSDAAGLAFAAIQEARAAGTDVLLVDTAGRLQNRAELMAELEKIIRVMRKLDAAAPHAVLLVLDATVGQNAMSQVEIFGRVAGVTGLVMTKLDGTARGGILVAITERFKLPVHFIGVGETAEDLEPFAARDFGAAIAGLDEAVPA